MRPIIAVLVEKFALTQNKLARWYTSLVEIVSM